MKDELEDWMEYNQTFYQMPLLAATATSGWFITNFTSRKTSNKQNKINNDCLSLLKAHSLTIKSIIPYSIQNANTNN